MITIDLTGRRNSGVAKSVDVVDLHHVHDRRSSGGFDRECLVSAALVFERGERLGAAWSVHFSEPRAKEFDLVRVHLANRDSKDTRS